MDETRQLIKDIVLNFDGIDNHQFYNRTINTPSNTQRAKDILPLVKACFQGNAPKIGRIKHSTNVPASLTKFVAKKMGMDIAKEQGMKNHMLYSIM